MTCLAVLIDNLQQMTLLWTQLIEYCRVMDLSVHTLKGQVVTPEHGRKVRVNWRALVILWWVSEYWGAEVG